MRKNIIVLGMGYAQSLHIMREVEKNSTVKINWLFDINNRDERSEFKELFENYLEDEKIFIGLSLEATPFTGGTLERLLKRDDIIILSSDTTDHEMMKVISAVKMAQKLLTIPEHFKKEEGIIFVPKNCSTREPLFIHPEIPACTCSRRVFSRISSQEWCPHILAAEAYNKMLQAKKDDAYDQQPQQMHMAVLNTGPILMV